MKSTTPSIRGLNNEEFEQVAKPLLLSLCKDLAPDPLGQPFTDRGLIRGLLFEMFWTPIGDFAQGLIRYCEEHDEQGFYVSLVGIDSDYWPSPFHWYIPLNEIARFREIIPLVEYVIYSEKGTWAVVAGIDEHALFTCPAEMLEVLEKHVTNIKRQVNEFLDYNFTEKQSTPQIRFEWLPSALVHLYGEDEARDLLVQSKLAQFFKNDPLFRAGNPNAN